MSPALPAVIADAPERFAVIDCGTNSIKLHLAERTTDGTWHRVLDRAEVTRLGEGLEHSGSIGSDAVERTVAAIAGMVAEAKAEGALAIAAVGTAGLRIADNSAEVVGRARASRHDSSRGHLGRRGEPPGLRRRHGRARAVRVGRRLRHRRRQQPVHVRPRPRGRRAVQPRGRGGPLHRDLRPGRGRLGGGRGRGPRGDRRGPRPARRPGRSPTRSSGWAERSRT